MAIIYHELTDHVSRLELDRALVYNHVGLEMNTNIWHYDVAYISLLKTHRGI